MTSCHSRDDGRPGPAGSRRCLARSRPAAIQLRVRAEPELNAAAEDEVLPPHPLVASEPNPVPNQCRRLGTHGALQVGTLDRPLSDRRHPVGHGSGVMSPRSTKLSRRQVPVAKRCGVPTCHCGFCQEPTGSVFEVALYCPRCPSPTPLETLSQSGTVIASGTPRVASLLAIRRATTRSGGGETTAGWNRSNWRP